MNLIEIFKAGKRLDANGVAVNITTAQLQQAVDAYDPAFHESPAVIGHPKDNHPAYAWVKRLQLDGDTLKAEFDQIDPEFAEMVALGRFKKVSSSFYLENSPHNPKKGTLYLRHVGFLGAMPPAVKGLKNPVFNETEADNQGIIAFEEPFSITTSQGEPPMDPKDIEALKAQLAQAEDEKAQAQAEVATLKAEKEAAEEARKQAELDAAKAENVAFCEQLIADGKLAPVAREAALALLDCSATTACGQVVEFNEGESILTLTKAFLNQQPAIIQFGEVATKERVAPEAADSVIYAETDDPARIELDRNARAYMQQHQCDYATAISAVM